MRAAWGYRGACVTHCCRRRGLRDRLMWQLAGMPGCGWSPIQLLTNFFRRMGLRLGSVLGGGCPHYSFTGSLELWGLAFQVHLL